MMEAGGQRNRPSLSGIAVMTALLIAAGNMFIAGHALAQSGTVPRPGAVETLPLPPPPGLAPQPSAPPSASPAVPAPPVAQPAPPETPAPQTVPPAVAQPPASPPAIPAPPAQAQPAPQTPASPGIVLQPPAGIAQNTPDSLLAPGPTDPNDPQDVMVAARLVAILPGQATWEEALPTIRATQKKLADELSRLGVLRAGRPLSVFTETDDVGFKFETLIPIAAPPAPGQTVAPDVRFGENPAGRAIRIVHRSPYEEIDVTFEAITVYLDARGVEVRDQFVEEYVNDIADPLDGDLEINIYVFPR